MTRRVRIVFVAAVLTAGLAATLAALAGSPSPPAPDPQEAILDGCGRNYIDQTQRLIPTWVYVGDRNAPASGPPPPPQRLEGVISSRYVPDLAVHPTEEDLPPIHRAYDFNFDVLPDAAYAGLLGGDPAQHTGNYAGTSPSTGRVHVEREQAALPRFAWPEKGDRVAIVGSWIWDCGHWTPAGERTEIHSYRALWVARRGGAPSPFSPRGESEGDLYLSSDRTYAGVEADCAHAAKGDRVAFQACLATESRWQDISGTYSFSLRVPPRPARSSRLKVRVLDAGSSAGAPRVHTSVHGRRVDVTVTVDAPAQKLVVAKRVLAGWTGAPAPVHLRVRFVRLLVRRAMDPGCPNGAAMCGSKQTTHGEQISTPPGEWNVYLDAGGIWTVWGNGLVRAHDGQVFRNGPDREPLRPSRDALAPVRLHARMRLGTARQRGRRRARDVPVPAAAGSRHVRRRRRARDDRQPLQVAGRVARPPPRPPVEGRHDVPAREQARLLRARVRRHARRRPVAWGGSSRVRGRRKAERMAEPKRDLKQDLIGILTDRGEDVVGRIVDLPATQRVLEAGKDLRERVDELQKKVRGIDELEKRVAALERRVAKLTGQGGGRKTTTTRAKAKPKAKPKPKADASS